MNSRTPDFKLKAMDKTTGVKSAKIGAAWTNKDGSISVVLDPFVTVTSSPSVLLTLFPWDEKPLSPVTKAGK
jgi:hypothetical protein